MKVDRTLPGYLETGSVPREVGGDPEYELVLDEAAAANTGRAPVP